MATIPQDPEGVDIKQYNKIYIYIYILSKYKSLHLSVKSCVNLLCENIVKIKLN